MSKRLRKRQQSDGQDPPFNLSRRYALITTPPPFRFNRVMLHYFPLRADISALQNFCDDYINIAAEFAFFRPSMPYVLLVVANYPRMSVSEGNLGWTSSNELLFTIPLDWYIPQRGDWVFKAPAQFAPYIFVNNEASQVEGREVYGWPKVQGWLTQGENAWIKSPLNPRNVLNMTTYAFEALYADKPVKEETFISIDQAPSSSVTQLPVNPSNPLNPLVMLPKAMSEWGTAINDLLEWALNGTLVGAFSPPERLLNGATSLAQFVRSTSANTINLKQIRDALVPRLACYQALTNARTQVTKFRAAGLLSDVAQLRGDLSGGYEISLREFPSLPIVESLGLKATRTERMPDQPDTAVLKPTMPFWQELDLEYTRGENIAWRSRARTSTRWRNDQYVQAKHTVTAVDEASGIPYIITGSAGFQVPEGPFHFPNATIRVLPLLANAGTLATYLEGRNAGGREDRSALFGQVPPELIYFEPLEPKVYLIISTYGDMESGTNNIGLWDATEVRFSIPVRSYRLEADGRKANLSLGLVSAFVYSSSELGTTIGRELNGWPSMLAQITSLPNSWAEWAGPFEANQPLMRVSTLMPVALNSGQPFEWRSLLDVIDGNVIGWQDRQAWQYAAIQWGQRAKQDLARMHAQAEADPPRFREHQSLAMNLMAGNQELNEFSFKQLRDAKDPQKACYQAVVAANATVKVHEIRELGHRTSIRINKFPTQPIVETLGLVCKGPDPDTNAPYHLLQACRPFFIRAAITTRLGENVCERAAAKRWRTSMRNLRKPIRAPGADFVDYINEGRTTLRPSPFTDSDLNPQNIARKIDQWAHAAPDELFIDEPHATDLLSDPFEPHMVIHAMLSGEWEQHGNPRWYRAMVESLRRNHHGLPLNKPPLIEQLPPFVIPTDCVGTEEDTLFPDRERVANESEPCYWTPPAPGDGNA